MKWRPVDGEETALEQQADCQEPVGDLGNRGLVWLDKPRTAEFAYRAP